MGFALPAALGLTALGGVTGAIGAEQQASASATASKYQAAVSENNAAVARNNALMTSRIGEQKATQQELKNRAQLGAIVAGQAANGVDVNTGSAKQVQDSAHILGRLDTETIKSDAAREAHAYDTQASGFDAEAKASKKAAKQAKTAGHIGAFTSLLDAAASGTSMYLAFSPTSSAAGAPTQLSTGANVLNTDYWGMADTGTIY